MAGKVSLKTLTENDTLPSISTPILLTHQNVKTQNSPSPASQNKNSLPLMLPILDASSFSINQKNISYDQTNHGLNSPLVMDDVVLEIGASSRINNNINPMVSLSHQEGPSINSDSSSIAMNKCVSQPEHASDESMGMLMDFGFGFPFDVVNGFNCHHERVGEFAPSYYPEWVDLSYADIKPHN